ncbi:hypothetical protein GGI42DRAFT_239660 [Trichoderma sp. SZMC 28013]
MHIAFNTSQAVPDFDSTATNREQGRWGHVKGHHASSFFPLISPALGGAHVGANYPRQGRPRAEIRHQGWAVLAAVWFERALCHGLGFSRGGHGGGHKRTGGWFVYLISLFVILGRKGCGCWG